MKKDYSALLPDGSSYGFWETEPVWERELFVNGSDPAASDDNDGSEAHPFRTISRAAAEATPGTRVRIHAGLYRECVKPARGGTDPEHMISYEAFGDGDVVISASEEVRDFIPSEGWMLNRGWGAEQPEDARVWEYDLDPDLFRGYNPFCAVNILHDRLFIEYDKTDMTTYLNRRGCVFCDGKPLKQVPLYGGMAQEDNTYWVEANGQKVHFRLEYDEDPKDHRIEVTVREQCFAPDKPFLNYIRVKNLVCEHAATGAPVPQRGAISACRGHHWIIEGCTVYWTNGVAIDVGNECWHHEIVEGQIIGSSVVRGCAIRDAGVWGVILPVSAFVFTEKKKNLLLFSVFLALMSADFYVSGLMRGGAPLSVLINSESQPFSLLALPLLALYNGKRGKWRLKYFFYVFYPAHLGLIYLIGVVTKRV